jgi:cobalamin biosynthesis protein CobW
MQLNKIPATVVTGFLGSGKTTLLSNILKQSEGKRIAVIVNEFGELDIDADTLRQCPVTGCDDTENNDESGIYELANGCICCTVEEEFLPVMQELVARRDDIDHILIETSGLALPKPLVQAFNWPDIKQHCTVDSVITVIDGPAVADGRFAHDEDKVQQQRLADESLDHDPTLQELLDDQLSAADMVIVSKNDLLTADERQTVEARVDQKVPEAVKVAFIEEGNVPLELVMGVDAKAEDRIESIHTHHDHHHDHDHDHTHAHDHFDSHVIELGVVDHQKLQACLLELLKTQKIYRAKGFAAIDGKPMRQNIQAVGERVNVHFDRLWVEGETPKTQLVFIGKGISHDGLKEMLRAAEV